MSFKVGDKVRGLGRFGIANSLWYGEMEVVAIHQNGDVHCKHPLVSSIGAFSPGQLQLASSPIFPFQLGDKVRLVKLLIGNEWVAGYGLTLGVETEVTFIPGHYHNTSFAVRGDKTRLVYQSKDCVEAWQLISSFGDIVQVPKAEPAAQFVPPHICEDAENRKTYDSGWSRYDYCKVCDKKIGIT